MRGLLIAFLLSSVPVAFAQAPAVSDGGVINAASFTQGQAVAPGSLISIFGTNLASGLATASSIPLSVSLGDVTSVTVNGVQAPLLFVSGGQINAQIPWEVQPGPATVVVSRGGAASAPSNVTVGDAAPGVFALQFGSGQAIAINIDGSLAAAANSVQGFPCHPASAGSTIILLATGLGAVTPPATTANNSMDTVRRTALTPVVLIGGVQAQVTFSGLSPQFVGVNQLNVVVPAGVAPGPTVPVQIQLGGITSTDKVTMAVQ